MQYDIPRGPLVKLLLCHIREGHRLLNLERPGPTVTLFCNSSGKAFTSCTFVHYWMALMKDVDTLGQQYFPPSAARTMYVEHITRSVISTMSPILIYAACSTDEYMTL